MCSETGTCFQECLYIDFQEVEISANAKQFNAHCITCTVLTIILH